MESTKPSDYKVLSDAARAEAQNEFWKKQIDQNHDLCIEVLTSWVNHRVSTGREIEWNDVYAVWWFLFGHDE